MSKCPTCGAEYEGNFCPNGCNAPKVSQNNQQQTVPAQPPKKKNGCLIAGIIVGVVAVVIIVIIVVSTSLFAKGVSDAVNEVYSTQAADYTAASYGINKPGTFDDTQITVTKVEHSNGSEYMKPDDGKEYIIVTVKIKNVGKNKISYNPFDYKMSNSKGQVTSYTISVVNTDTALSSGELTAGGEIEGTLCFEQPKNDSGLKLEYYSNLITQEKPAMEFVIK